MKRSMPLSQARPLPSALVIGPQKTGTSWLHESLARHGDVELPSGVKETFFFDRNYERGLAWYSKHFPGEPCRKRIEVAPTYFHAISAPERIKRDLGAIPLVVILRDPAERAYSLYLHMKRRGLAVSGFLEACEQFPEILSSSRYATHIRRWLDAFGRERILTTFYEDLWRDPYGTVSDICAHFGLEPPTDQLPQPTNLASVPASLKLARTGYRIAESLRSRQLYSLVNAAKALGLKRIFFGSPGNARSASLSPEERAWFLDQISEEVSQLEVLLDRDLAPWKST